MKRILFLLLLTVSVYGQNPSRFAKIQITGNSNSGTATKVNVQEANGEVNTQTINTGFNKNIGLGGSDVVGANTLLNQYSTTPVDWTATAFNSGQVVFYGGKQWIAKIATVAVDVPSVSSKWEEITFEALANKTVAVDQTIIDGSTNAVSGNAVFDGLATKAPISSVHNPVTLGTANGLSLATQQLSLGLASSGVTGALSGTDWTTFNGKFNTPSGLTANYLPKWNGSGFGNSNIFDNGTKVGIGGTITPVANLEVIDVNQTALEDGNVTIRTTDSQAADKGGFLTFGGSFSGTSRTVFGGISGRKTNSTANDIQGYLSLYYSKNGVGLEEGARLNSRGALLINKTDDDLTNQLQVAGTISASPAVSPNQVVVKSQLDAVGRPYKVYTALLSQSGTNAPVATVLENTLGGTIVWSRNGLGTYSGTLSGVFTTNKTYVSAEIGELLTGYGDNVTIYKQSTINEVSLTTIKTNNNSDGVLKNSPLEIRVYN